MKRVFAFLKNLLAILIGAAILIGVVAWMSGAFRDKVTPGEASPARAELPDDAATTTVRAVTIPVVEEAAGAIIASRRTAVSARVMATIHSISVRAGDKVDKGETLAVLDNRDFRARLEQAQDSLAAAEATLKVAQYEYERRKKLLEQGVIAKADFDQAERDYNVAKAEVSRAKQAVEEARVAVSYTDITAPTDGRIVDRFAEPGDTIQPGQPIVRMYDPSSLQLEAGVRETLAGGLSEGDRLTARIDALDETMTATVAEIVPQAEVGSRVFRVKAALPDDERLYTGMFGRLVIPVGEREALVAPRAAIEAIGQNRFMSVVDETNHVSRRLVTVGPEVAPGEVEILSGVSAGERVVVR